MRCVPSVPNNGEILSLSTVSVGVAELQECTGTGDLLHVNLSKLNKVSLPSYFLLLKGEMGKGITPLLFWHLLVSVCHPSTALGYCGSTVFLSSGTSQWTLSKNLNPWRQLNFTKMQCLPVCLRLGWNSAS